MRHLLCLTTFIAFSVCISAQAVELQPLADCAIKVFKDINRSHIWSGKAPFGCSNEIYVEKRPSGIFVAAWDSSNSASGWERLALSVAVGYHEVANRKSLQQAARDISARSARIGRCLDSILRVNDPLECRDHATKTYSAGDEMGIEYNRSIWLDDNGRHVVVEYAYGDTRPAISPEPADLLGGPPLPPGTNLDVHIIDTN